MNYFLKKKKWMAWVVLLTFLFTSFMPSNLLAGNSVAEAAEGTWTVTFNNAEGAEITSYTVPQNEGGAAIEAPVAPAAPEGKVFAGWYDGKQTYGANQYAFTITANTTFQATYKDLNKHLVQIVYQYEDGTVALPPYQAYVEDGQSFSATVKSPQLVGFAVSQETVAVNEAAVKADITETVTYTGSDVDYTIEYQQQNLQGTGYEVVETEKDKAKTGTTVKAEQKNYEGFTPVVNGEQQMRLGPNVENNRLVVRYDRNSYLLTVDTDGGSYVAPQFLKYGASISLDTPTKLGYTFAGWVDKDGKEVSTMPAHNMVVKANWIAKDTASYTVVYWQEKVPVTNADGTWATSGNGYDFVSSETKSGRVGTEAVYTNQDYKGFSFQRADDVTIAADGSTVLNVYYDRNTYMIHFYEWEWYNWVENDSLRITAKYGTDVSAKWNQNSENTVWGNSNEHYYTLLANMPAKNLNMYGKQKSGNQSIVYYVQSIENEKTYTKYAIFTDQSFTSLTDEDKMPIEGFKDSGWKKNQALLLAKGLTITRSSIMVLGSSTLATPTTLNLQTARVLHRNL